MDKEKTNTEYPGNLNAFSEAINAPGLDAVEYSTMDRTGQLLQNNNMKNKNPKHSHLVFEPDVASSFALNVPESVGVAPSAKRQDFIVKTTNKLIKSKFSKEYPMYSEMDGYKFCAYDTENQFILITIDTLEESLKPWVQELCNHFWDKNWTILAWVGQYNRILAFRPVKSK
jgi:hypothetical protein